MQKYEVSESGSDVKRNGGMFISHGAGFVMLLLAICMALGVGLIVHFASPGEIVCKCDQTEVPTLTPEELRGRCVELVEKGDVDICTKCDEKMTSVTTTSSSHNNSTMMTTLITPTTTTTAPKIHYRLPTSITPHHYTLELQPEIYGTNSSLFTFNGTVAIIMNVTATTSNITLHRKDINVTVDSLFAIDGMPAPHVINTTDDLVREFYVLHLDGDLVPGRSYEVKMSFVAKMRTDGSGLYTSSYKADNNQTVYLATTQFEAPEARKCFPCFDEPALKATFDVTLVRKKNTGRNYITLANTETISSEDWGDYIADKKAKSVVMPTYLLAFIVCDFEYKENFTSGTTYRTWARPNMVQYTDRAHKYGVDLFDWFEAKFEPAYPLTKLDNIAIPDFVSGAMENWGLITYRETILYEPGISTASADSWTAEVVSHEIAHMWFGNIVSPKWWWWLWLNEAFASFWDFHAVQAVYPMRRATEQFIVQAMHYAFEYDGRKTSHPMTNDAESREEVDSIFDTITYSKGACIVRMMHFTMGDDMFIRALNLYLTRHQYGVAEHQDLWNALTEQSVLEGSPINMTDIMDPWVTQMNFPLVTVYVVRAGVIHVKQERWLNNMSESTEGDTAPYNYRWTIPITMATSSDTTNFDKTYSFSDIKWLHHTQAEGNINDASIPDPAVADSWVLVNLHQFGYYRVNYEDSNWMAIIKALETNHETFPAAVRAQLMNDAWNLQKTGRVKMSIALRTLNFLKDEVDYVPWRAFAREIGYLDSMLERSDVYGAFTMYMRRATHKTYNHYRMTIDDDTLPIIIFQAARGANYACTYAVEECKMDSLMNFRAFMNDTEANSLNPNLIGTIMCSAVKFGGIDEWNFAYSQYWNSTSSTVRSNSLLAMSCTTDLWLVDRMLEMSQDEDKVRAGDARWLLAYTSRRPQYREVVWNFIKNNYEQLAESMSAGQISGLIGDVTDGYNTEEHLAELKHFAEMTSDQQKYSSPVKSAISRTETNKAWMAAHYTDIRDWLGEAGFTDYLP